MWTQLISVNPWIYLLQVDKKIQQKMLNLLIEFHTKRMFQEHKLSSKSTFSNSTAKSYALALYEISKENSLVDKIENEIKSFQNLLKESSDFKEMI